MQKRHQSKRTVGRTIAVIGTLLRFLLLSICFSSSGLAVLTVPLQAYAAMARTASHAATLVQNSQAHVTSIQQQNRLRGSKTVDPTHNVIPIPTDVPVLLPTQTPIAIPTDTPVPATDTPTPVPTDTPVPATDTPTPVPTDTPVPATNTPTPAPTATPAPSFLITKTHAGGDTFYVGQNINYALTVLNLPGSGPETVPNSITITDIIPVGLTGLVASGHNWHVSLSATTSPATLIATYKGSYPVLGGVLLPQFSLIGRLTADAIPVFTNTATVAAPGDPNPALNTSVDSIAVLPALIPTATPSPTATIAVTPGPDLTIVKADLSGDSFQAGDTVTYVLIVNATSKSGPINASQPITVTDILPSGITGITVDGGSNWNIALSSSISPATATLTYNGPYPVASGNVLRTIIVSGQLTSDAVPSFTNSATVSTPGDIDPGNNMATNTILVTLPTPTPTEVVTLTATPTEVVTPTETPTPVAGPDLAITKTNAGGTDFLVGDTVTYSLQVSSVSGSGALDATNPIIVTDAIPIGLTNITVNVDNGWTITTSSSTSPALITATYTGGYPISDGSDLPVITVGGQLTSDAVPTLSDTATVYTPADVNLDNNSATDTVNVSFPVPTATPTEVTTPTAIPTEVTTPTETPTEVVTPTEVPTEVATPTGTPTEVATPTEVPTEVATPTGTPTEVATPTETPVTGPDLAITKTNAGGTDFLVGDTVTYSLQVSSVSGSGALDATNPITVTDIIPTGLINIAASANSGWTITTSGATSPALITATYTGGYPISSGSDLPVITVSGELTGDAVPTLADTATVGTPADVNLDNNIATDTINVSFPIATATATEVPTEVATATEVPTEVATPTEVVTPTEIPTEVATPTETPVAGPDLAITKTNAGGTDFLVGDTVTYSLQVSSVSGSGVLDATNPITVTDAIPVGLTNIAASAAGGWILTVSSSTSPALIMATYTGTYPIVDGSDLPVITVSGQLTGDAVPTLSDTATVSTPADDNLDNNTATDTINVSFPTATATPTEVPTEVATPTEVVITPTVTPTEVVTPTVTPTEVVTPTETPTEVVTPTVTPTEVVTPTATPTEVVTPTVTPTETPTVVPTAGPDLVVTKTNDGGSDFLVGQSVSYTIQVINSGVAGPVNASNPIFVTDIIPTGFNAVSAQGTDWNISVSGDTSPALILATYTGTYPVSGGSILAPITVTGTLTADAIPQVTDTATVITPDDSNLSNNFATDTIYVAPSVPTATATVIVTATSDPPAAPDLSIHNVNTGGNSFRVGKDVSYTLTVTNSAQAGAVTSPATILVADVVPVGMQNVTVNGTGWTISLTGTVSPLLISATYTGAYPVAAGATLPVITITGRLTGAAVPLFINSAAVIVPGDSNLANNIAIETIFVRHRKVVA